MKERSLQTIETPPADSVGRLPHDSQELVIGAVLGSDSERGLQCLLAALSSLCRSRRARLLIFGADDRERLVAENAGQVFDANIRCFTDEPVMAASLQVCDTLVSLQEGTPTLVVQAMSLGVPVITTGIRVPEVIQHQRTAICVKNGDERGLFRALLDLCEQPKRRRAVGAVARQIIAKQYSKTNLWRAHPTPTTSEYSSKSGALIKKALFGAVPGRQLIEHGNRDRLEIALTVDDGPDPRYTPRILDIFRHYGIKATFFVVGGCAEQYRRILLRMKDDGHEVGNHSYSHPYFDRLSWKAALWEIRVTCMVLKKILGMDCLLFRPPFGKLALRSLLSAWAVGQRVVMWSVDLKDYRAQAEEEVEAKLARASLSSGDIVLYHGVTKAGLKALPRVIEAALKGGRRAVTISELMQLNQPGQ